MFILLFYLPFSFSHSLLLACYMNDSKERYEAVAMVGAHGWKNIQNYAKNVQLVNVILFYVLLAFI
jgi:hypothetical protein